MPTPEYHARLSPSAAHRWLNCPASVALSDGIPSATSPYAEAGRLAHSIAELKARKRFTVMNKRTYTSQLKKLQDSEHYAAEMDGYTDTYVEILEQHAMSFQSAPFIVLESSVPVGQFTGETKPDASPATGTADCIQIGEGVLWISDYKNGSGVPVEAENNPQMMLYALGALALYAPIYGDLIQTVRMTIVQPALRSVSDWEIRRADLETWGREVLTPSAVKAAAGEGEPHSGDWCKFCPARFQCRERAYQMLALEAFEQAPPEGLSEVDPKAVVTTMDRLLADAEIGDILRRGEQLMVWYNDLKDYSLKASLAGREIPGWKAVEGRGSRDWIGLEEAFAQLTGRGVAEALLWERKPVTPPGLEKALGKKDFAETAGDLVVKQPGKPTLVPDSDKRPVYNAAQIAFGLYEQ